MGVSLYVMPLGRYLTRRFKTTWETRAELAGGAPGFQILPEGPRAPAREKGLSAEAAAAWLERFRASLSKRMIEPAWDEEADVLFAGTMSYGAFSRPGHLAGRFSTRARFVHLTDPLRPFWLPLRFPRPLDLPDPAGGDEPVSVLSSLEAREELLRMSAFLQEDPRVREIEELPSDSSVTGSLADFQSELESLRLILHAATLSVERRVPLIVEG